MDRNRNYVCEQKLGLDESSGKLVILSILSGGKTLENLGLNEFAMRLATGARVMRWFSCSVLKSVYEQLSAEPSKGRKLASRVQAHLWQGIEDRLLTAWTEFVLVHPVGHLSLHFDGLRLDNESTRGYESETDALGHDTFCKESEEAIHLATGFEVQISRKTHETFEDLLFEPTSSTPLAVTDVPNEMRIAGHGIIMAIALVSSEPSRLIHHVGQPPARTYREASTRWGVKLRPRLGLSLPADGSYLVHSERATGSPGCVGLIVSEEGCLCFKPGGWQTQLLRSTVTAAGSGAMDYRSLVTYEVLDDEGLVDPQLDSLLDLEAGAGSHSMKSQNVCTSVLTDW